MAHMLHIAHVDASAIERLGFYVLAPERQINAGVFGNLVTRESISRKVAARVAQYQGQWDEWFTSCFEPMLQRIDLAVLSWESILALLPRDEEAAGVREFYSLCQQFNPGRVERAV